MLSHPPLSPLRGGCDIIIARPHSPLYPSYSECSMCVTLCDVVCNNHSPAPIYGGYLPRTGVYCGACCAPCAVVLAALVVCVATCVCIVLLVAHLVLSVLVALAVCVGYMYVLWCLERIWCCQCLLHWAYVLAICGAWSTHMLAIYGAWSAPMCWLYVVLGAHIVLAL